jgi:DNA polymerase elongation subunit (family B)
MSALNVPLYVRPKFLGNEMRLERLERGRWQQFDIPFRPYIYAKQPIRPEGVTGDFDWIEEPGADYGGEVVERRLLSTLKPTKLWRYEFDTTLPAAQLNMREATLGLVESHVRFIDRVTIDRPDYYREYPYGADLRPLMLDIEGLTKNGRPLGKWWVGCQSADRELFQWTLDKRSAFEELIALIAKHDVITGYNIINYDWPILQRLAATHRLVMPESFLMYDVAKSVFADQTLSGIKSRGLKSVAKWYGFNVIEVDGRNTSNYSEKDLLTYNASDLNATRGLYDIYFPRLRAVAEYMGIPLEVAVEGEQYSSTISSIVCARGMFRKGIVSDGQNKERHPGVGQVQGAFVVMAKPGLYSRLLKIDFRQMYPSIILELNLGPDTTVLVGIERMEDLEEFRIWREGKYTFYHIPDANLGGMVTVRVDESEISVLREYLLHLGQYRDSIKKLMEGMSEGEASHSPLHAQENAIKVMRNALYGYTLSDEARFADKSIGVLVTAAGREMIKAVRAAIDARYGAGTVVEVDTDGAYVACNEINVEDVKALAEQVLSQWVEMHLRRKAHFVLTYSVFPSGWFSAAKNYILRDEKGNIIRHGAGFKGIHRPTMFDKVVDDIAVKLLSGQEVRMSPYYKWDRYVREDYLMHRSLGMNLTDYQHEAVEKKIAQQLLLRGESVETGQIMEYYQSTSGARAYLAEDHDDLRPGELLKDLDRDYYRTMLDKLGTKLGIRRDTESIEKVAERTSRRELDAIMEGRFRTCPRCKGQKWFIPKGKIMPQDCDCEDGKVLAI